MEDKNQLFKYLFDTLEMRIDQIEEILDKLEDAGEPVEGMRKAVGKLWDEFNEISQDMTTEEILKQLNYISGVHTKYIKEEILNLINKIKQDQ